MIQDAGMAAVEARVRLDAGMAAVEARMRQAVAGPEGDDRAVLYRWLRYHLGWADEQGLPVDARAAKGVRPRVCLLACAAVAGDAVLAVPAAAAVELTHEFSLVHDDIQDQDRTRRGRAALWTLVGAAQAITAGDLLFSLARRELAGGQLADAVRLDLHRRYDAACIGLAEGQHLDLAFETVAQVPLADYIRMVRLKTGALLGAAAGLGARAGGASEPVADAFARFGEWAGVAFQIQDDVLGLWGDPLLTGKPIGSDLLRRKQSLPVILGLADPGLGPHLAELYRGAKPTPPEAMAWADRLAAAGVRTEAEAIARRTADDALSALDELNLAVEPRAELVAFAEGAVGRAR